VAVGILSVQEGRSPVEAWPRSHQWDEAAISFPATLQHTPGSEIIKRLAEHAQRLSRRWERGGNCLTRFVAIIKTKTYSRHY